MCLFGSTPKAYFNLPGPAGWVHPAVPDLDDIDFGVIGWRTWRQKWGSDEQLIGSWGGVWRPERSMGLAPGWSVLSKSGSEGVYAHNKEPRFLPDIWGEVLLWGQIAEYVKGYRAEYAYPLSFFVSDVKEARGLKAWRDRGVVINYRCPSAVGADAKGYVEWVKKS